MASVQRYLAEPQKLDKIIIKVDFLLPQTALVVVQKTHNPRILVQLPVVGIRRITDDHGEALIPLDLIDGPSFVGQRFKTDLRKLLYLRFERIGQIDAGPLIAAKAVPGLRELQPQFEMRNGVRRGEQFVAVQTREQVLGNVLVPELGDFQFQPALLFPFGDDSAIDDIHGFNEEGGCAGGGVKDLDERFVGGNSAGVTGFVGERRELQAGMFREYFAPGDG